MQPQVLYAPASQVTVLASLYDKTCATTGVLIPGVLPDVMNKTVRCDNLRQCWVEWVGRATGLPPHAFPHLGTHHPRFMAPALHPFMQPLLGTRARSIRIHAAVITR